MCKIFKDVEHFEASNRYKSGYSSQCVQCRYTPQIESRLSHYLKHKYSMTLEEYYSILAEQNGVCAICKLPETRVVKPNAKKYSLNIKPRLAVDHDHTTGKNRGLLCIKCNIAIGHLQDSIENAQSAVEYLKKWKNNV